MRIPRYFDNLQENIRPDKVLVIYGPRQVGKTTLLEHYMQHETKKIKYDTGDDYRSHEVWSSRRLDILMEYIEGYEVVIVDEAQKIPEIGTSLKLIVDSKTECTLIITGSSSLELSGKIGEPLTGRKRQLLLYPVALLELKDRNNRYELKEKLEEYLLYGFYPEVLTANTKKEKRDVLHEITGSYLLKDILELEKVKSAKVLLDLLRLLAFQMGNLVSLRELGSQLGLDYKTVARYLDILEKSFVLFNVRGYSRNLRKEITKKSKYYFYDTGIRNSIISNFNAIKNRNDIGALWENFLFIERLKRNAYSSHYPNIYFWRTWDGQEIDYIEETGGNLYGYEFTWGSKKKKTPNDWTSNYPEGTFQPISRDNYLDFVL